MVDIVVPSSGESIATVVVGEWTKQVGDYVKADEIVVILETDKINVEVPSPEGGYLREQVAAEGDSLSIGDLLGKVEPAEAPADLDSQPLPEAKASASSAPASDSKSTSGHVMPAAQKAMDLSGVKDVTGTGPKGRVLKSDVLDKVRAVTGSRQEERVKMSPLRKKVAQNLVQAQQNAALLTTFNEVDMSQVMRLRKTYQEEFVDKHGVKLGFMSFFVKAAVEALKAFPAINAQIEGDEIVYHHYQDIGVAVGGGKGLVVPVLRNAEALSFDEIEVSIKDLAVRAQSMKLKLEELQGGTFTISNGGVYGSMLSTPIVNPPQSGILGLHNIQERPVAVDGKVEIRPMMFLALTYDHRIVDGREAVSFLVHLKKSIEDPARILFEL